LFSIIDELCEAFESNTFHAGMDEVFFIGEDQCPRCHGLNKAVLFAGEVQKIHDHLAKKGRGMWMWGDRLLDGKTTGLGEWEASVNGVHPAIDMIPKDIVICDWHYERPDKTPVYFATMGFSVITCPWRNPGIAVTQMQDMIAFREASTPEMKERFFGVMQTTWSRTSTYLNNFYIQPATSVTENTSWNCFRVLFSEIAGIK